MIIIPHTATQPSLRRALLARLMQVANANPQQHWYTYKTLTLYAFGTPDGYDLQRIEAPCHRCNGEGHDQDDNACYDCDNGVHHITRTLLARWQIEGVTFHQLDLTRLTDAQFEYFQTHPEVRSLLTGRVRHHPRISHKASAEAYLWFLLLLSSETGLKPFLRALRSQAVLYPSLWPLLNLQRLVFNLCLLPSAVRRHWANRRSRWHLDSNDIPF